MNRTQPVIDQLSQDSDDLLEAALEAKLKLSVEERIEAHENARELFEDLREAGKQLHAKPQTTP